MEMAEVDDEEEVGLVPPALSGRPEPGRRPFALSGRIRRAEVGRLELPLTTADDDDDDEEEEEEEEGVSKILKPCSSHHSSAAKTPLLLLSFITLPSLLLASRGRTLP
jgi:hypothetical protein